LDDYEIELQGFEPQYKDGKYIIVAGFYHNLKFQSEEPNISLKKDNVSYHWFYDNGWKGDTSFINKSASKIIDDEYHLVFGINAGEEPGLWNLTIDETYYQVYVEEPTRSVGYYSPDFELNFEPFTEEKKSTGNTKFILENNGNSILKYEVVFDKLSSNFELSNPQGLIYPGQKISSNINLTSEEWNPGYFNIEGNIILKPTNVISNETFSLIPQFTFDLVVNVTVGHENYHVINIGDGLSFQHLLYVEMDYNRNKTVRFYLSGEEEVEVNVEGENIKILSVKGEDIDGVPFTIDLEEGKEYAFDVKIKAKEEGTQGKLIYTIDDGTEKSYETIIDVEQDENDNTDSNSETDSTDKIVNTIIIIIGILIIISYIFIRRVNRKR
jgi:hypothetical protein